MRNTLIISVIALLISSCSSTKLLVSMSQENLVPKSYSNLGVAALFPDDANRLLVENALADEFTKKGVHASITFHSFPLAGKSELIESLDVEPGVMKKMVVEKIKQNQIDVLLIITLLDSRFEERFVDSRMVVSPYYDDTMPVYNQRYYDYYANIYSQTYTQGYYTIDATYVLEANLYDIESENLIWTGQSITENIDSIDDEAEKFARLIVQEILERKVILKSND